MLRYRACKDWAQGTAQTPGSSTQVSQNLGELPLVPHQPCRQAPLPETSMLKVPAPFLALRGISLGSRGEGPLPPWALETCLWPPGALAFGDAASPAH